MEFLAEAFGSVSEFEQEVAALLYGFDGRRRTPEQVAQQCRLSLAQVEQTAKAVMRRMRHPASARLIREALATADERIWSSLAGAADIVYKAESLPLAGARLPGELLFAIECQYGSVGNWLSANARVTARAWYRSPFPEAELERLMRELAADTLRLPLPLESLARGIPSEEQAIETAAGLSGGHRLYSGYVAGMPIGTRAPRAVRLHRILSGTHAGEVVRARQLVSEYRSEFADDACTFVDVQASMASFPHLFLRLADLGWCGIGAAGKQKPALDGKDDVTFHRWSEERKSGQDTADRDVIRQILEERGPLRLNQVQRLVRERSNGGIPPTSVGMYLYSFDEFMRLAPGVYGLSGAPVPATSKLLLNRGACLHYVLARGAGEPADAYPLWTPAMEAEWCEWAQSREKNLLGSLLSVVDPSDWPAPDSYQAIWRWKKECLGYYRLETAPRYPFAGVALLDLLALVKCARWRGAMNWVLANRVTGRPILNRGTVSVMALLIGVGAVVPAYHWQRPHAASPGAAEIDDMLSAELHRKGSLAWDGPSGGALFDRLAKAIDDGDTGWVPRPELARLLDRLTPA